MEGRICAWRAAGQKILCVRKCKTIFNEVVCSHEKTRLKSQILDSELNADYETIAISGQFAFYFN